jgi:hypothetical protein
MTAQPVELQIPPHAAADRRARELVRVWAAGGKQHITLATGLWKDPASWGVMLVDLAKLIADAYQQTGGPKRADALQRIKCGFDAEWAAPTDAPFGQLLRK